MKESLDKHIRLFKEGKISEETFRKFLENIPYHDMGNVKLDFHRPFRRGLPEVIYGKDKDFSQLLKILKKFKDLEEEVLVTRISHEMYGRLKGEVDGVVYHEKGRVLTFEKKPTVKL